MLTGTLTAPRTSAPALTRRRRAAQRATRPVTPEHFLPFTPHLDAQLCRGTLSFSVDAFDAPVLDFRAAARALTAAGLLGSLLTDLKRLPPTHALLSIDQAEAIHVAYHGDLLEDVAGSLGVQRDLLTDAAYEAALIELDLPVYQAHLYAPVPQDVPWPDARPRRCPAWLWRRTLNLRSALRALPVTPEAGLCLPGLLYTHDDRLPELHSEIVACVDIQVEWRQARPLLRAARQAHTIWAALRALNDTALERA